MLAGVDERLCNDLLRIVGRRDPGRKAENDIGGVGARRRGVRPQPAVRIETGPHKIQPAARGIRPERLRDNPVFGEQVDDLRAVAVDGVLQRGGAPRPAAGVGAAAEQEAHILHPVEDGGLGKREVQVGGLADQDIHCGARHTELRVQPDTGDRLPEGQHVQQGVGLPGGQPGQPIGVAGRCRVPVTRLKREGDEERPVRRRCSRLGR